MDNSDLEGEMTLEKAEDLFSKVSKEPWKLSIGREKPKRVDIDSANGGIPIAHAHDEPIKKPRILPDIKKMMPDGKVVIVSHEHRPIPPRPGISLDNDNAENDFRWFFKSREIFALLRKRIEELEKKWGD